MSAPPVKFRSNSAELLNVTHGLNAPLVVRDEGEEFLCEEGD